MRLDNFLVKNEYFTSRAKAQQAIERGEILVDGKAIYKSSFNVLGNEKIDREFQTEYVSIGGFKMEKALQDFSFDVKNFVVADIGASTGGFTDCLIKNGAKKVYSIDLNDQLLDEKLKRNDKVFPLIKNAKYITLQDFNEPLDLIVADLSFISEKIILPIISNLLQNEKHAIILIKPQFEYGEKKRFKNGIIKDVKIRKNICLEIADFAKEVGLNLQNITTAPLYKDKNVEYLFLLGKNLPQKDCLKNFQF